MTFIGITADGSSRPQLTLKADALSPRPLRVKERGARIALVSTTALLLAGDHVRIDIDVGPGCWLEVVDTAGLVAYDAQGKPSSWTVTARVADGGLLLWKAEPFVIATGADVTRSTTIELAHSGVACVRETLILGRTGEVGGALLSRTRVSHCGQPLLVEDLDLRDAGRRQLPGLLGGHRVIDTVSLLGRRAPAGAGGTDPRSDPRRYELAGTGTVARHLGSELHRSRIPAVYSEWKSQLLSRTPVAQPA